ncbi:MAG: glycoside hydrolase family 2 [Chloroflexales bacterium]|nr:glycoside hydrolase family 2 [Chloroflexales bacterium]
MTANEFELTGNQIPATITADDANPLPRSVARGGEFELLDGAWRFALDLEDRGLRERWYLGHSYEGTARWPGTIEAQMAAAQEQQRHTAAWQDTVVAWYERDFAIPERWYNAATCPVQVTFGASAYETRAWLNGHALVTVEGEETHTGAYTSFSYELPPGALLPVNRLSVRIAHSLDAEIPRGKQESRVYKRGGIWYQTISGPVRSVWIEPIERNRLRSRLSVYSQIARPMAEFTLTLRVHDPGHYPLHLQVADEAGIELAAADFVLPLEVGEQRQRLPVPLPNARLWSPEAPNLYRMTARLTSPDGAASQISARFGLRQIAAQGDTITLNGKPIYLDGILYQPNVASYDEIRRHMLAMRALGCNLVRVHIAGIDPRIYDLADELGILLWVEVPSPHSSTQRSRENHWAELQRMLVMVGAHPSVVIWSLYNEDWGVQDIATNAATRDYIAQTYNWMRVHVPHVLVVDNDGWRHVSVEGRLASDLFTAHLYTPELDRWEELLGRLSRGEIEGVAAEALAVGDDFFYRGQIPLVISEWGGFGFAMYGGPSDEDDRAARIRAFKAALRHHPVAGDVYTQATSIEQETNGLIDPSSGDLLVPPAILSTQ